MPPYTHPNTTRRAWHPRRVLSWNIQRQATIYEAPITLCIGCFGKEIIGHLVKGVSLKMSSINKIHYGLKLMSVEMPNAPYFERYYREYRPDSWLFEGSYHGLNGRRAQKAAIEYLLGHNFSGTEIYTQPRRTWQALPPRLIRCKLPLMTQVN